MSVTTEADRRIREAKTSIDEAKDALMRVLNKDSYGIEDYGTPYVDTLYEVVHDLEKMNRKL